MDIEEFLLEMADSDECRRINYKRLAIRKYIGVYYAQKPVSGEIDSFMIPFRDYVRHKIEEHGIDIDVLAKYMISTDESNIICIYNQIQAEEQYYVISIL